MDFRREVEGVEGDTVADYLEVVRPDLPPALIGLQALSAIDQVARCLPGVLALTVFGFECNLSDPEPIADFCLLLPAERREQVAREIPNEIRDHPVWRRLRTFLDAARAPRNALSCTISNVYLEFDVSDDPGKIPVPNIFHDYQALGRSTADASGLAQRLAATCLALTILTERAVDPVVLEKLRSCFELLPPGAQVTQVGAMIARDTDAFRVCVHLTDLAPVRTYLDRLGWDGERNRLAELLEELSGRIDYVLLNVDVAESIRPKIGIECYLAVKGTTQRERWAPFLAFLVDNGMVLDAKGQALLRYPGYVGLHQEGRRWPPHLRQMSDLLHPAAVSVFLRRIHHVKLVLEPGRRTKAKAYLAVRHAWVTPGSLT